MRSLSKTDRRRILLPILLPLVLGLVCRLAEGLLPEETVWGSAASALLLSAPRWCMLLYPIIGLLLLLQGRRRFGVVLGLCGGALAGLPLSQGQETGQHLVFANVQAYSGESEALEQALAALQADVVITVERRADQVAGMVRVADNFDEDLPKPSHGAAVFCRDPEACEAVVTPEFGAESCGMPIALLRLGASLCVVGVHVPPPVPVCATGVRPYVREIHSHIREGRIIGDWGPCRTGDPVLAAGDFNAVPGSWALRTLAEAGLERDWDIRGVWGSTWPAGGGWPDFPVLRLDHVLTGEVEVHRLQLSDLPGADHKALELWVD